jgi:hypothetical protein
MGSGLPQLGLPRRFAMDLFPRYSGGGVPQHFILSFLEPEGMLLAAIAFSGLILNLPRT